METTQIVQETINNSTYIILIVKIIAAVFVVSIGTFAAAIAQGNIAQKACESLSKANEVAEKGIRSVFFTGIMFVETCALYCVIIAFVILFVM
jgi:F0F1-type ATP synthase membrane subunit c/vacuolar-type H+-ATPase subunit K